MRSKEYGVKTKFEESLHTGYYILLTRNGGNLWKMP